MDQNESLTLTITEVAKLLGISRALCYRMAKEEGKVCGVAVFKAGRRIIVPRKRFLETLDGGVEVRERSYEE